MQATSPGLRSAGDWGPRAVYILLEHSTTESSALNIFSSVVWKETYSIMKKKM